MRLFMGKLRSRSERQFNYTYKEHIGGINKNQCPRPKDHQRSMAGSVLQWNLVWILQEGDIYLTLTVTNVPAPAHSIPSLGCGYDQTYSWWLVYFVRTQVGKTPRIWVDMSTHTTVGSTVPPHTKESMFPTVPIFTVIGSALN